MSNDLDDLLGPAPESLDDLLGPAPKVKRARAKRPVVPGKRAYKPLPEPKEALPHGIFAMREQKGKNLGRTCLNPDCKKELHHSKGRPPILCRKKTCYRWYRNAYRAEYDRVRPS